MLAQNNSKCAFVPLTYRISTQANVHAIIESDERVSTVVGHIDKALEELESMENWLLLYAAELNVRSCLSNES